MGGDEMGFGPIARASTLESLPCRILLSVTTHKETLIVEGTAGRDVIRLSLQPGNPQRMLLKVNSQEWHYTLGRFKVIDIKTRGGADWLRINDLGSGHPAYLDVDLGPGNDRVIGSPNADRLYGGTGNDRISAGDGNDLVSGGAGADIIVGEDGVDTLNGVDGPDTIFAGEGDDLVYGGRDADSIDGGNGIDTIDAGAGNDRIVEMETPRANQSKGYANRISGSSGDDYIRVEEISTGSSLFGGSGNDYLVSKAQRFYNQREVQIWGEDGDDKMIGVQLFGGAGNDTLVDVETTAPLSFNGDDGQDTIRVTSTGNPSGIAKGGAGNDHIDCGSSSVWGYGDEGDDSLTSRSTGSDLHGGSGNDTIDTNGFAYGDEGDDVLRSREATPPIYSDESANYVWFYGGDGNDVLYGSVYDDLLDGGPGNDALFGNHGDDTLYGDAGNDRLFGESGSDWFWGGDDNDRLVGGSGLDHLRGGRGTDYLFVGDQDGRDSEGKDEAEG
jgi:Ca2+-binding RTX toxin-like protein